MIRLSPYPCFLKIKVSDRLREDCGGETAAMKNVIIVTLSKDNWRKYAVHEVMHVIQAVERYIEQKLGDEEEAYLAQWIYDLIGKYIISYGKAGRRKSKRNNRQVRKERIAQGDMSVSMQQVYGGTGV